MAESGHGLDVGGARAALKHWEAEERQAREQAKKNELAAFVDRVTDWVQTNQQAAVWGGGAIAGGVFLAAYFIHVHLTAREDTWSRLAVAQTYAYSGY